MRPSTIVFLYIYIPILNLEKVVSKGKYDACGTIYDEEVCFKRWRRLRAPSRITISEFAVVKTEPIGYLQIDSAIFP